MSLVFATSTTDLEILRPKLFDPHGGALVLFEGRVRAINLEKPVSYLFYEAYEILAKKEFDNICQEVKERFGALAISAIHRLGRAEVGEVAVIIAVLAGHRKEAFDSGRYAIDALKSRCAIWKKEVYDDQTFSWDLGLCQCRGENHDHV